MTRSRLSYSSSSLPNNSIIVENRRSRYYRASHYWMSFYCCSNSTSAGTNGTFIGLNSIAYSGIISISRESASSSNAGCMYLSFDNTYYWSRYWSRNSYEQGIYTCRLPDATGKNIDVNVGIYRHGYRGKSIFSPYTMVQTKFLTSIFQVLDYDYLSVAFFC